MFFSKTFFVEKLKDSPFYSSRILQVLTKYYFIYTNFKYYHIFWDTRYMYHSRIKTQNISQNFLHLHRTTVALDRANVVRMLFHMRFFGSLRSKSKLFGQTNIYSLLLVCLWWKGLSITYILKILQINQITDRIWFYSLYQILLKINDT